MRHKTQLIIKTNYKQKLTRSIANVEFNSFDLI